jgi:hypothetical protein
MGNHFFWDSMLKNTEIEMTRTGYFDHEKWDVYQAALELVILIS